MLLAVIATFTLSSSVLTNWKIHYLTAGGNFYEKLHPATYFTLLAFSLLLIRSRGPVGELNRMFSESKLLLVYLLCWLFLLVQVFVLERPFTVIIDTFLLPILIALVIWQLARSQKATAGVGHSFHHPAERRARLLRVFLRPSADPADARRRRGDGRVALRRAAGPSAHGIRHRGRLRSGAGSSSGALSAAAGAAAADRILPGIADGIWRPDGAGHRAGGDRAFRVVRGVSAAARQGECRFRRRFIAICVLFAAGAGIFAALDLGIFDKMLLRFSSDKGSALARFATFNLLSHFDWHELILGPEPGSGECAAGAARPQLRHREFLDFLHRPVRHRSTPSC